MCALISGEPTLMDEIWRQGDGRSLQYVKRGEHEGEAVTSWVWTL